MKRSAAVSKRAKSSALVVSSRAPRVPTQLKRVRAELNGVKAELGGVKHKAAHLIARNPFRVLAGALAAGFVFAKLKSLF